MIFTGTFQQAILEALAYSDIFEYPLRLNELYRYLPMRAEVDDLSTALESLKGQVGEKDGFYFLRDREEIVKLRRER